MKVVVTGATGFMGGAVARRLAAEGAAVHGLTRGVGNQNSADDPIQWHTADVTKPETLHGLFADVDWVIHAAGMLGRAGVSDATYNQINAEGLRHVLQEATERGNSNLRVLQVGSAGVLGPLRDPQARMDETAPLAPSNGYERSKALAEHYAWEFAAQGLPVVIARPEFIYGPGDVHVLGLFQAIQRGMFFYIGDGRNTCHPMYIDDAVVGLLCCLQNGRPGETYHILGPRPLTFHELAETIAAALGVSPPHWHMPLPLAWTGATALELIGKLTKRPIPLSRTGVAFFSENRRLTSIKAAPELGYVPQIDLAEGIGRTVAWYRQKGLL